ncbi:hypothetical protein YASMINEVIRUS_443 [Yasminevirus sp. GU-2018]|uniref:Uncharacterized protein n=1 Tax=Yasminevirus sp. GU-2018 TaxID=2420051 RepID=A0A5K0U842_9VIRU|nr:hypothetical protein YASMINEVIRUS_443 [Yasminevirus sp. GU-2018]
MSPRNSSNNSRPADQDGTSQIKEMPILCIGLRGTPDKVRAIKIGDSYIFPPYDNKLKWSEDGANVVINLEGTEQIVFVPKNRIENTYGQCWGINHSSTHVSNEEFFDTVVTLFERDTKISFYGEPKRTTNKDMDFNIDKEIAQEDTYIIIAIFLFAVMFLMGYYLLNKSDN